MEQKWEVLPDARDRQIADMQAEIERLRALLSDGREIVAGKLPAYRLWVKDVDAALAPDSAA